MREKCIYKVLFIERDPVYGRLIRNMLAENGSAILKLEFIQRPATESERPATGGVDVILLDLGMPDSQGFDTLSKVHAQTPDVAIVVLASLDDESMIIEAMEAGAQEYLVKKQATGNVIARSMLYAIGRKVVEKRLRESEERYRSTLDNMLEGCQIIGYDWRYLYLNDVVVRHGRQAKESLLGHTIMEMYPGIENTEMFAALRQCMEKRIPRRMENEFTFSDGVKGWFELSIEPIPDGIFILSLDITERKKMQEQLMVNDRLASIGELAAGIAHELNNPLTGVIGFSDLLLLNKDVSDDVREDLEVVNREAKRAADVVKNLLVFARKHPYEKKPVAINEVIQNVLELRTYEQKVHNIQVNTQFASDLPEIVADGFQLQQVFLNLIINAEQAMLEAHGKGALTINTERVGDIIRASFADDGPGIDQENLRHLFDPFFTTKEVGKGTGLGLSICHGIITEHGGRIYAESELGKGATFIVELPISTADKEEP